MEYSPELEPLQEGLDKLWQGLEETPSFAETEITSRVEGDLIAVRTRNPERESYRICILGSTPIIENRFAKKPFALMPRIADDPSEAQIRIYLEKLPSGYNISGCPVVKGLDWVDYVHEGEAVFKVIPEHLRAEGIRLLSLRMMAEADQRDSQAARKDKRTLDFVKKATGYA